jgi:hypothetical protein
MRHAVEQEGTRPEVPDYGLDMHTARGIAMGRGLQHFWEVGAQINRELAGRNKEYRKRLLEIVRGE